MRSWFTFLPFLLVVACGATDDITSSPSTDQLRTKQGDIGIQCVEGCLDPDPDPAAPGIYLAGLNNTPSVCFDPGQPDSDGDGFSNHCEIQLAIAFSPLLSFYSYDQVDRETRWFANPMDNGLVRLGYLLGYYYDVGNTTSVRSTCTTSLTLPPFEFFFWLFGADVESCQGHAGDSEFVLLDVRYDWDSQHWVLDNAILSTHGSGRILTTTGGQYPPQFTYPEKKGGYPQIWVSNGKHANYESKSACDNGGSFNSDDCGGSRVLARANVMASGGNIGNHDVHLIDGVTCINPEHPAILFGSGCGMEYYFTDVPFRGWFPGANSSAESYASILSTWMPPTGGSILP
ncbi:MAG: hypothetical protein U0974_10230 [Gemmatimonadales bacterium]|nr:hypothetical protein [Gemmatimonadales bacterium]MDZ4390094.1 hypothetical protein [Gemmatimonadales bacterium]